jgi:nucleotide-binding universal stress UspA family protein
VNDPTVVLTILVTWLAIGVVLSVLLGRRGHSAFAWFVIGLMLGPLAIPIAVVAWRRGEDLDVEIVRPASSPAGEDGGGDRVDVLVGFDGSAESRAALHAAIDLFGARLGRLTLATAIPYDGGIDDERHARQALAVEADRLSWLDPGIEVVHGRPGAALVAAAASGGYDLLSIGTTGAGRAHLFGSAARDVSHESKVPVLLSGATADESKR